MKYGQIAGNKSINDTIYRCFGCVCGEDERRFVSKFRQQPHNEAQILHTYRELVLGAYLASKGLKVRYGYKVDTKTPDWAILDDKSMLMGIIELVNFHTDRETENAIEVQLQSEGHWDGCLNDNHYRLYGAIQRKATIYKPLVEKRRIPYVIAVFGDFLAAITRDEIERCLFCEESGLFGVYPVISGLLYFEHSGSYEFHYIWNPRCLHSISLPDGVF